MCTCAIIASIAFGYMMYLLNQGNNILSFICCVVYTAAMITGTILQNKLDDKIKRLEREIRELKER